MVPCYCLRPCEWYGALGTSLYPKPPKKVELWIPSFPFRDFGRSHQWLNRPFTAKNLHMYEIYEGFPIPPKQNLTCVNYEAFNRRKEEKKKESFLGHLNENDKQHMLLANLLILCRARPSEAWNAQTEQRYKASSSRKVRLQKSPRNIMKI